MAISLVESFTVGSGGAASITLSGIPQTADDLLILFAARSSADNDGGTLAFNSSGTYVRRRGYGTGSGTSSDTTADFMVTKSTATANTFSNTEIYVYGYRKAIDKNYFIRSVNENNATLALHGAAAGNWNQTAAITSITLTPNAGNFAEGSTVSLYLIRKS